MYLCMSLSMYLSLTLYLYLSHLSMSLCDDTFVCACFIFCGTNVLMSPLLRLQPAFDGWANDLTCPGEWKDWVYSNDNGGAVQLKGLGFRA